MKKSLKKSVALTRPKHARRSARKHSESWLESVKLAGTNVTGSFFVEAKASCCGGVLGVLLSTDGKNFQINVDWTAYNSGDSVTLPDDDLELLDPSEYKQLPDGTWDYAALATKHYLEQVKAVLPSLNNGPIRPITNVAAVWEPEASTAKISSIDGGAYKVISLNSLAGHRACVGIGLDYSGSPVAFGVYTTHQTVKITDPLPLSADAKSYALEVDLDHKTGQTTFWINDVGLDMGVLDGFKGGAHFAGFGGGTMKPNDQMLSGRLSKCAVGSVNRWRPAELSTQTMLSCMPPHVEIKTKGDSYTCRDLRSVAT
ncbi:MAG TPA: hypothetical protein VHC95_03215 [Opitutales bacterium]|nr:hypothetical protein [Opitutales bacterium]